MRLFSLLLALLCSAPALGETVRVAVTRGQSFRVEGPSLSVRSTPDGEAKPMSGPLTLEMVGPFVSTGDRLEPAIYIEDAAGMLTVDGIPMAGNAQITADKSGLVATDIVDLELYVAAVVGSEMPSEWPAAALQAQAIATRTYVLEKKHAPHEAPYDVESTVISQVYRGRAALRDAAVAATRETESKVLVFGSELIEAFFFASCVGSTETAANAFGHSQPYLASSSCELPRELATWTRQVPLETASKLFQAKGLLHGDIKALSVDSKTTTGRVATARLSVGAENRAISGADLRRALGYQTLPSLDFKVERKGAALVFSGRGAGHGVGLCQWCAREMAMRGKSADEILAHFYPGTTIRPMSAVTVAARP